MLPLHVQLARRRSIGGADCATNITDCHVYVSLFTNVFTSRDIKHSAHVREPPELVYVM